MQYRIRTYFSVLDNLWENKRSLGVKPRGASQAVRGKISTVDSSRGTSSETDMHRHTYSL